MGLAIARARLSGTPIVLSHLVTGRCCCKCETCLWRDLGGGDELTADQIVEVYRDAAACGIALLSLWGGEPLLRPDLPQIVQAGGPGRPAGHVDQQLCALARTSRFARPALERHHLFP